MTKRLLVASLLLLVVAVPVLAAEEAEAPANTFFNRSLSFFREMGRRVREVATLNPEKKLELQEKFNTERLQELQGAIKDKMDNDLVEGLRNRYETNVQRVRRRLELQNEASEMPKPGVINRMRSKGAEMVNQAMPRKDSDCAEIAPPSPGFCSDGKIIGGKPDKNGCPTPPICDTDVPSTGVANPASVHCTEQGHALEMREGDEGTYGVCISEDGTECEEWELFRGECELSTTDSAPTLIRRVRNVGNSILRPNR